MYKEKFKVMLAKALVKDVSEQVMTIQNSILVGTLSAIRRGATVVETMIDLEIFPMVSGWLTDGGIKFTQVTQTSTKVTIRITLPTYSEMKTMAGFTHSDLTISSIPSWGVWPTKTEVLNGVPVDRERLLTAFYTQLMDAYREDSIRNRATRIAIGTDIHKEAIDRLQSLGYVVKVIGEVKQPYVTIEVL